MKLKLFSFFLALVASVGMLHAESGTCGENLTWNLTDGVLTISGTGNMSDYDGYSSYAPWYASRENIVQIVIENGVTSIGACTFYGCSSLTSFTIPNSVTSIGNYAFQGCSSLTSITIPNSVTSIGRFAFTECTGLTSLTIGNSVEAIWEGAFSYCPGLTSIIVEASNTYYDSRNNCNAIISTASNALVTGCKNTTIPNSVTIISIFAFCGCSSLTSITIPNSVTSIYNCAFYGCNSLTSVTIPNSVTSIYNYAFSYCPGLTSIIVETGNTIYDSRNNCNAIIETASNSLIVGCKNTTIPNSVTSIGNLAFYQCSSLTSVTFPNSVTSIGNLAFYQCSSLTSITMQSETPPTLDSRSFDGANISNIYVPCGSLNAYQSSWKEYASLIKYESLPYTFSVNINNSDAGRVDYPKTLTICDNHVQMEAIANYGYHFTQWSDGVKDNPRTIVVTQDTTFTAEFAKNEYTITIASSNSEWGSTAGGKKALYLDEVEISATPNYGYHFVSWNDGNTNNPRTITVTKNETFTATFAKNVYSITKVANSAQGSISGPSQAEYLDQVTLKAEPNYGYYFTQWSDGNKTNPRTIELTRDTTFTAEFAPNQYTLTLQCNNEQGTVEGAGVFDYHAQAEISATPAYGYHFSSWSDGSTANPRKYTVTKDVTLTANFAPNIYSINVSCNSEQGQVTGSGSYAYLSNRSIEATPNYGYHFTQWSDRLKDNPRTIVLTQDTTFTAEFAKNEYTITTASSNSEWGSTAEGKKAPYMDEVEISATPNYGYHFVSWNDGNTNNPRIITVTENATYTATFAKNTYSIAKQTNAEQGYISGVSQAEYLDYVTLTATPNYGYHFTQWSDGLKDNPRIFVITQDTAFTAEFAYDRVGTCGKDLALVWSYDPVARVLTIGNAGAFTENMQFGVEAPAEMEELVIGHSVTSIGDRAFTGIETLKKITIGESVKTIGEQAFYNCVNLETIYNYRPTPTNAYSTAFDGVDKFECVLYVLPNSIDLYKNASVWRDFYYTYAIGATAATVNEVSVTPTVNTAAVTWPAVENAATYELVIKDKSGNVVCTLVFNANGQLTAIAFAAPGRAQASTQATGFSFTVTGLDSGTGYDLTINAKDDQGQVISTTTQSFTTATDTTTGIDATTDTISVRKQMINGQLFILRDGKTYTVQGQQVK